MISEFHGQSANGALQLQSATMYRVACASISIRILVMTLNLSLSAIRAVTVH